MIARELEPIIEKRLFKGKVILVLGPRQTGKTTLMRRIAVKQKIDYLWLDADDPTVRAQLTDVNIAGLKMLVGQHKLLVIDEAQQVQNVGLTLKLIVDHIPDTQLLVSGSSALELASGVNEPLTVRKFEYQLFPFSFNELVAHEGWLQEISLLEQRLIYGSYPEVVTKPDEVREHLVLLAGSYLYKDVFRYKDLRKPELLEHLLQLLALQLGSEVSYNELARQLGADIETVQRYINLLEQTFVIFRLRALSRNHRNEIKKSRKVYFYDNGIRNALINNFSPLELRADKGALWENYLVAERLKFNHYNNNYVNSYFWRTHQQQEIDYIEEKDGMLFAFEFKWSEKANAKMPATFVKAYPNHRFEVVTKGNYSQFLSVNT
jgi:uncharacterized protein